MDIWSAAATADVIHGQNIIDVLAICSAVICEEAGPTPPFDGNDQLAFYQRPTAITCQPGTPPAVRPRAIPSATLT
jgi:hypothetical protein